VKPGLNKQNHVELSMSRSQVAALITIAVVAGCSENGPRDGTFSGVYVYGFETSSFTPCRSGDSWWLSDPENLIQLPAPDPPGFESSAFLRVRGRRSAEGQHGHLGAYRYEIVVRELLVQDADTAGKC
jgi:hypothetical protein